MVLQRAGPSQDPGESQEEGQSPRKQHPAGAGLAGTRCSLHPCTAAVCHHAGLEGWAAAAPGTADLPLRWADGEIITEWDGEEPVDFLAPGIMCAGSLGSCSAMGRALVGHPTATPVREALGSIPELSMFQ